MGFEWGEDLLFDPFKRTAGVEGEGVAVLEPSGELIPKFVVDDFFLLGVGEDAVDVEDPTVHTKYYIDFRCRIPGCGWLYG